MIDLSTLIAVRFRPDFDSYQIVRSLEVKLHPLLAVVAPQGTAAKSNMQI